jgi:hypothetical protein
MARKVFLSFRYEDLKMNVAGRPLADQQTAAVGVLIELQGM